MREAQRLEAWSAAAGQPRPPQAAYSSAKSQRNTNSVLGITPRRPPMIAHAGLNRRKQEAKIEQENSAFLRRLKSVKSAFTPRKNPSQIPALSPRSRLIM